MSRNGNLKGKLASHRRLPALVAILIVCMCAGVAPAAASSGSVQPLSSTPSKTQAYAACAPKPAGVASCLAVVEPVGARLASVSADAVAPTTSGIDGSGLAPSELQSAYKLPSSSAGSGQTVAIVDAYNDPTAESDLAAYRAAYGLPACTTAGGCFDKVNQTGGKSYPPQPTAEEGDWPIEESLDLDMVSAVCPNCHIVLVEANSAGMEDLGAAENEAAKLGTEISNSWGSFEFNGETAFDSYFDHPGIPITVASGDYGYDNEEYSAGVPSYPAASPDVIAVGGTNLTPAENSRGWTESVWAHSGSGCSHYEPKPSYQTDSGCSKRTTNDIAAAAEDLSIYDTSGTVGESEPGWFPVGGTSAATPIIASYEALSSSEVRSEGASAFYKNTSSFFPVTSGSNGSCGGSYLCTGGSGYRGPTGVGTPDGVIGGGGSAPAPKLEVTSVSPKEGPTAGGTSVTIKGADFVKGATVKIGAKAATSVTVRSESEITAVTAAGAAGSDEVIVTDEHGTSSGGPSFTYVAPPAPSVSSVTPATGTSLGGTTVTVKGSGFTSSSKVTIGSKAGEVTVLSEHELTAVTKKSTAGAAEVVVSNANGTSSGGPSFTYVAPPVPAVHSISPSEGSTTGGTTVTITGSGFLEGASVKIGGRALDVTVVSSTKITATTASGAARSDEVIVTDGGGTSSGGPLFTYHKVPALATSELKLTCGGTQVCAGTLTLSAVVAGGPGVHASVSGGSVAHAARRRVLVIGTGAYALAPGSAATVKLTLDAAGRALVRSAHAGVAVTLSVHGSREGAEPPQTRNVRLDLVRRSHGPGGLKRSAAPQSGGLAAVSVGAV